MSDERTSEYSSPIVFFRRAAWSFNAETVRNLASDALCTLLVAADNADFNFSSSSGKNSLS